MDTRLKGDVAEQAAILKILQLGWAALRPIGDRLPYDLVIDVKGKLVKCQVKCAWYDAHSKNYVVDVRRTKTNRRVMLRSAYTKNDFDFALVYVPNSHIFYIFPVSVFIQFGSSIYIDILLKPKSVSEERNLLRTATRGTASLSGLHRKKF